MGIEPTTFCVTSRCSNHLSYDSKKLFPQVFCDLGRCRNLQSASVEQAHFPMIMGVGFVAFVTDNAIDCCAAHPELAFLWCFFFHV